MLKSTHILPNASLGLSDHRIVIAYQANRIVQQILYLVMPQEHQLRLNLLLAIHVRVTVLRYGAVQIHVRTNPLQIRVVLLRKLIQRQSLHYRLILDSLSHLFYIICLVLLLRLTLLDLNLRKSKISYLALFQFYCHIVHQIWNGKYSVKCS